MPVQISDDWVDKIRDQLPEKPFDKQRRYRDEMNLPYSSTSALCGDRLLCEFFETAAALTDVPAKVANWVVNDLLGELGQTNSEEDEENASLPQRCKVTPNMLADLVNLIEDAVISNNVAKEIFSGNVRFREDRQRDHCGKRFGNAIGWGRNRISLS